MIAIRRSVWAWGSARGDIARTGFYLLETHADHAFGSDGGGKSGISVDRAIVLNLRTPADFDNIARVLNAATGSDGREIGVVFNAYNLKTGQAVLFGNDKARRLWPREKRIQRATPSVDVRGRASWNVKTSGAM